MISHDVRVHPSKDVLKREDQLAWKIAAVAADKVKVMPDVTDMIVNRIIDNAARRDRVGQPFRPHVGARHGARPSAQGWCDRVRRRVQGARQPGMGRLGQRHRGARAGHARHLPRRRLLPSRRQHPADPGRGADHGEVGRRPGPWPRDRLRDPDRPGARDLPARAQDRSHRPSVPGAGRRHRHPPRAEDRRHLPGRAAGGSRQLHDPSVPQGRDQLVEGLRPRPIPASWPSRRWTAPCAAKARRPRSTKARTA